MSTEEILEGSRVFVKKLAAVREVQRVVERYDSRPDFDSVDFEYFVGVADICGEQRVISRKVNEPWDEWTIEYMAGDTFSPGSGIYWIAGEAS